MFLRKKKTQKPLALLVLAAFLLSLLPGRGWALFGIGEEKDNLAPEIQKEELVLVLVEKDLLDDKKLGPLIGRYGTDIQRTLQTRVVQVPVPKEASPLDIYEGIAHLYFSGLNTDGKSQLLGTVLFGEVPLPVVEKNGNLYPSIFPYVDLENPVYKWDQTKERFVYEGGDEKAEIWHGIIRMDRSHPDESLATVHQQEQFEKDREKELADWLELNHDMHTGEDTVSFGKRVLYVDLPRQKYGLSDEDLAHYTQWINDLEDIMYLRFNKHWAQEILQGSDFFRKTDNDDEDMSDDMESGINFITDINTKDMIRGFAKRYMETYMDYLSVVNTRIAEAGRWDASQIDTPYSLVSRKDEAAGLFIRGANDQLEEAMVQALERYEIPTSIWIQKVQDFGGGMYKPLYWNGYLRSEMIVEDCSLLRGSPRTVSHPRAQMVEANHAFTTGTEDDCESGNDPNDPYAGCCAENRLEDEDSGELSIVSGACDTGSVWLDAVTHQGAEIPVFDLKGTREITEGSRGAAGCQEIFGGQGDSNLGYEMDSLMIHDEPRLATIQAQIEQGDTRAMPVDDPRGVSFWATGVGFTEISFPKLFDLRSIVTENPDQSDSWYKEAIKGKLNEILEQKINEINTIHLGTDLPEDLFDSALGVYDLDRIAENILWLDKPLYEKNRVALEKVLSDNATAQDFFIDPDFDGYEVIQFVTDRVKDPDNEALENNRIAVAFENTPLTFAETYEEAKQQAENFVFGELPEKEIEFFEKPFGKEFLGTGSVNEKCEGKDFFDQLSCRAEHILGNERSFVTNEGKARPAFVVDESASSTSEEETPSLPPGELAQVEITPAQIARSTFSTRNIPVTVRLLDANGNLVESDFESEVELLFSSRDASKFFRVSPDITTRAVGGEAQFYLIAKLANVGGKFSLSARVKSTDGKVLQSENVPVLLTRYGLRVSTNIDSVPANSTIPIRISARVVGEDLTRTLLRDGNELEFLSDWGEFPDGSTMKINKGQATISFLPGAKSGKAEITVRDLAGELPDTSIYLDITPGDPALLQFSARGKSLLVQEEYVPVTVELDDLYENRVEGKDQTLTWSGENIDIKEAEGASEFTQQVTGGEAIIHVRAVDPALEPRLQVVSDALPEGRGRVITFQAEQNVKLKVTPSVDSSIVAGSTDPVRVEVEAFGQDGKLLDGVQDVYVQTLPPNIGRFPESFQIESGKGEFSFLAGTKMGKVTVRVGGDGFADEEFTYDVVADKAVRLEMTADRANLDMNDSDPVMKLTVRSTDQYGNTAPFEEKVTISINEESPSDPYIDDRLIELGVIEGESGSTLTTIREEEGTTYDITSRTDLIDLDEPRSFYLENGKREIKLTPKSRTGKVKLAARAKDQNTHEELVPGIFEFDITESFTLPQLDALTPKSVHTMLLGFDSGELVRGQNFANRWLFTGQTQSVSALITDPNPKASYGYVSPKGEISPRLRATYIPGATLQYSFHAEEKELARAEVTFSTNPSVFTTEKEPEAPGLHFFPLEEEDVVTFNEETREISLNNEPILNISPRGGVQSLSPDTTVNLRRNNSLLYLNVVVRHKEVLQIDIVPDIQDVWESESITDPDNGGIFLRVVDSDIEFAPLFTGKTTNDPLGLGIYSKTIPEEPLRKLGFPTLSAEDTDVSDAVGWQTDWKPGTLLAADNITGDATKWGMSDVFIFYGDPVASVLTENTKSSLNLTDDVGTLLWKSEEGVPIDAVFGADINGDESAEILALVGNELKAFYQDRDEYRLFRPFETILRFSDLRSVDRGNRARTVVTLDIDQDQFWEFIHVRKDGSLVLHRNNKGTFTPEVLDLHTEYPILKLATANLNGDGWTDLIAVDEANTLYTLYGLKDGIGFDTPRVLDHLTPRLQSLTESYTVGDNDSAEERYFGSDDTPNLDEVLLRFDGVTRLVDEEHYSYRTGEADPYVPLPYNRRVNATLVAELPGDVIGSESSKLLYPGDKISFELQLTADMTLRGAELIFPEFVGMKPDFSTLRCVREDAIRNGKEEKVFCAAQPELNPNVSARGLHMRNLVLPAQQTISLRWDAVADDLPPVRIEVADFYRNDGIDDIAVPWMENGERKYLQYISHPTAELSACMKNAVVSSNPDFIVVQADAEDDPYDINTPEPARTHSKEVTDVPGQLSLATAVEDDTVTYPDTTPDVSTYGTAAAAVDVLVTLENDVQAQMTCGNQGCGSTTFSVASSNAPGVNANYSPPYGNPGDVTWGAPNNKRRRLYNITTNTQKSAKVLCTGSKGSHMEKDSWNPNCKILRIRTTSAVGGNACTTTDTTGSPYLRDAAARLFNDGYGEWNSGTLTPKYKPQFTNIQIAGADVITNWIQAQYRELTNYNWPRLNLLIPKLSAREGMDDVDRTNPEGANYRTVKNSALVNVDPYAISVPYPQIPTPERIEDFKREKKQWETSFARWKVALENRKTEQNLSTNEKALIDESIKKAEKIIDVMNHNLEMVTTKYPEQNQKLFELRPELETRLEETNEHRQQFLDYYTKWIELVERQLKDWERYREELNDVLQSWEFIPEEFYFLTTRCSSCSAHRGTLLEWVMRKHFLSGHKFPVVELPRFSDITLDFTRVSLGLDTQFPSVSFHPVELSLLEVPTDLDPTVHILPEDVPTVIPLPEPVDFKPLAPGEPIEMPPFLTITSPTADQLPTDMYGKLKGIAGLPFSLIKTLCRIITGKAIIPEWFVRENVELLTNRQTLAGPDFSTRAVNQPVTSFIPADDDTLYTFDQDLSPHQIGVNDDIIRGYEKDFSCLILNIRRAVTGAGEKIDCESQLGKEIVMNSSLSTLEQITTDFREWMAMQPPSQPVRQLQSSTKGEAQLMAALSTLLGEGMDPMTLSPENYKTWTAAVINDSDIPESTFLTPADTSEVAIPDEMGIYYFDPATETSEAVTTFPVGERFSYAFPDLDGDNEPEVLYSIGSELYLKYRVEKSRERETDKEMIRQDRERYSDFVELPYESFRRTFLPAQSIESSTNVNGARLRFEPLHEEVDYLQWDLSDRPEIELEQPVEEAHAFAHRRYQKGILLTEPLNSYAIRPTELRVVGWEGDLLVEGEESEVLPNFTPVQCADKSIEKPYFLTPVNLAGVEGTIRIEVRVPPRPGQEEQFREIILRNGEETYIPQGEVCVTRGKAVTVGTGVFGTYELERNMALADGDTITLDEGEQLNLLLKDETRVDIQGPVEYSLAVVDMQKSFSSEAEVSLSLPMQNWYGVLTAYGEYGTSFPYPTRLSSPQLGDDILPPELVVDGNGELLSPLFAPVIIDASRSYDEHEIAKVWWDLDALTDSDEDGDPLNDNDFPGWNSAVEYPIGKLLKISLSPRTNKETIRLVLHAEDRAGNYTYKPIRVQLQAPRLQLLEASRTSRRIMGRSNPIATGVPVSIYRQRDGLWEQVGKGPLKTNEEGIFELTDLSLSGGIEFIAEDTGEVALEILPNGRVVREDERFGFYVVPTSDGYPFGIRLHDQKGGQIGFVGFESVGKNPVIIDLEKTDFEAGVVSDFTDVHILDTNKEDGFEIRRFSSDEEGYTGSVALIDTQKNETLAVIDQMGNLYQTKENALDIQTKFAGEQSEPVIFQIFEKTGGKRIAELFIPVLPDIHVEAGE